MRQFFVIGFVLLVSCFLFGCGWDDSVATKSDTDVIEVEVEVIKPGVLVIPRGVTTDTGDQFVRVWWYATYQEGVDGYRIYCSNSLYGEYDIIGEVAPDVEYFDDLDVENGVTYYYFVSAFSNDGRESDLSYEEVEDTPRPEGVVKLDDYILNPDFSGFDFTRYRDNRSQPWARPDTDIYFGVDISIGTPFIYSANGSIFQDLGGDISIYNVDSAPQTDYVEGYIEAFINHVYAVHTVDDHYAVFKINDMFLDWYVVEGEDGEEWDDISEAWMEIEWAVQLQKGNPELAPGRDSK
ncbi:MAG: hypothetical protein HQ539_02555 [Parcubacteria group bacterium]|nr:hypothetical protein [Parcubacteria group bacterium]